MDRFDEVISFRDALSTESDRGCALFAASYLDGELEALLRQRFVDDKRIADHVLQADGSLGTFSARIDVAFLLGLIGDLTRRDLHLIRKIRNEFGHSARSINFSEQSIASRCRELTLVTRPGDMPPRGRFTNAVLGAAAMIHSALDDATHIGKGPDIDSSDMAELRELTKTLNDVVSKARADG